jgi:putative membrane protein
VFSVSSVVDDVGDARSGEKINPESETGLRDWIGYLPHLNATLNTAATILLLSGLRLIKQRRERAHKWAMIACFVVSILFLTSYLTYHGSLRALGLSEKRFPTSTPIAIRYSYYAMLLTHVVLAATVPILATTTLVLGLRDSRAAHLRWARWTFPIWLYVSVTGIVIYLMLYQVFAA